MLGKIRKITATFEIVTPMFLGGADHEATRIRETSIKGALVFWWRALNYARFVEEADGDQGEALEDMQSAEQELFGGGKCGQSGVLIKVVHGALGCVEKGDVLDQNGNKKTDKAVVGVGARYLGYGLMGAFGANSGKLERACIKAGQIFEVKLAFHRSLSEGDVGQIIEALKLFGLLGGLGSRVRRGWGSVALVELDDGGVKKWKRINSQAEYKTRLKEVIGEILPAQSGCDFHLTAFAKESRIWITDKRCSNARNVAGDEITTNSPDASWSNPLEALDWLGRALINYRSWGQNAKVGDQPVQEQFIDDHDWFRESTSGVDVPYRAAFGLPHMYNSKAGEGVTVDGDSDRRASPMQFHVHKSAKFSFGVILLLPTKFLGCELTAYSRKADKTTRNYSLDNKYGTKIRASGLDVLLDFAGKGTGEFKPNQLLTFEDIF